VRASAAPPATPVAGTDLSTTGFLHLEIRTGDDQSRHLLWQEQPDNNNNRGVFYAFKCPGGSWTVSRPFNPGVGWTWQFLNLGSPHLTIDKQNQVAHVVLVELDDSSDAADGNAIWATLPWTCP
jgi:hypothetical protein